jgi:hypothetical protein
LTNNIKIAVIALTLIISGVMAAHNAKWLRDGVSPWWTPYIFSFVSATIYSYLVRANLFSLTYTSVFNTFFFHAAWYSTAIFVLGEQLANHRLAGLFMVFGGMILMSIK